MYDFDPLAFVASLATVSPWVWLALTLTSVVIAVTASDRDVDPAARRRVIDPAVQS